MVSWSVLKETGSLDLLTVGNLTFSGDIRHSIIKQRHNDWVLVIQVSCDWSSYWSIISILSSYWSILIMYIQDVTRDDSGTYICTLQTYPPQDILVNVKVLGERYSQ